jgi:hypothetical protein
MSDADVLSKINELVAEERELLDEAAKGEAPRDTHARLEGLQVTLDQCWDLLRQRRAQREVGGDPDSAQPRSETTVERYVQ